MIQGAVTAGLLPEQPLLARLDTEIETATAAFLNALDNSEKPTARLHLQNAAQAADDSWPQAIQNHSGPTITNPTVPEIEKSGLASQHDDDDSETTFSPPRISRLSAPQPQAQLSRLSDRTRLRRLKHTLHTNGAWQLVTKIEDL